jgi:hypothetical protein
MKKEKLALGYQMIFVSVEVEKTRDEFSSCLSHAQIKSRCLE